MLKSGIYKEHKGFSSFTPFKINREFLVKDSSLYFYIEKAGLCMGEIKGLSSLPVDVDFFLKMISIEEEKTVEGVIKQLIKPIPEIVPHKRDRQIEMSLYLRALRFGLSYLKEKPFSRELLVELHKILVYNPKKMPGKLREKFTWCAGETIEEALFVPPPAPQIDFLLTDLEDFWSNEDLDMPLLLKVALTHYQFITIHPFMDGNGRVARLLVALQLLDYGILKNPLLYFTEFQICYRKEFKKSLYIAHETGDVEQRARFFILGMIETAKKRINLLRNFQTLYSNYENAILSMGKRRVYAKKLLCNLFKEPFTDIKSASEMLNISYNGSRGLLKELEKLCLLKEISGIRKGKFYILSDYIELFLG